MDSAGDIDNFLADTVSPYNPSIAGYQDDDPPCCKIVKVSNPISGVTIDVTILDRCCSCVGKCKLYGSDPSCGSFISNGATIDLSQNAFQTLYGQTTGVFPIYYDGSPWLGNNVVPDDNPNCVNKQ